MSLPQLQTKEEVLTNFSSIISSRHLSTKAKMRELRTWAELWLRGLAGRSIGKGTVLEFINETKYKGVIKAEHADYLHQFRKLANNVSHENANISYTSYLRHVENLSNILQAYYGLSSDELPDPTMAERGIDNFGFQQAGSGPDMADLLGKASDVIVRELDYVKAYIISTTLVARQLHVETSEPINGSTLHTAMIQPAFLELNKWLAQGMNVCLVEVEYRDGLLWPEFVVYEPDYLMDVTTVATAYATGHKLPPQVHQIKRWEEPRGANGYTVLGHYVNQLLDKMISAKDGAFDLEVFKQDEYFGLHGLDLAYLSQVPATMIKEPSVAEIFAVLDSHAARIRQVIADGFLSDINNPVIRESEPQILRKNAMLEPTFVSPIFGVQGRLDLLHDRTDQKVPEADRINIYDVVELKSGSSKGFNTPMKPDHYAQAVLYHLMLKSAYGIRQTEGNVKLLYSNEPMSIRKVWFGQREGEPNQLHQVIATRNNLVWLELELAKAVTNEQVLELLDLKALKNPALGLSKFEQPKILEFVNRFESCSPLVQNYILSWIRFVLAERAVGKIGSPDDDQRGGLANLWLKDRIEKIAQSELLEHLSIRQGTLIGNKLEFSRDPAKERAAGLDAGGALRTGLRKNDRVVLYPMPISTGRRMDPMSTVRNQIVKANIDDIDEEMVRLSFNHPFLSDKYLKSSDYWAIEKDVVDNALDHWINTLCHLPSLGNTRLGLLLGEKSPATYQADSWPQNGPDGATLSDEQQRLLRSAVASPDYYLLMGPPGTGKTRFMLKNLAWYYGLHKPTNVLLMAYTNRAVDEICEQLVELRNHYGSDDFNFIRVGHNLGTGPVYREFLLSKQLAGCRGVNDVKAILARTNVFVGTASSLYSQISLFGLKQFDVLIVDEASQILEPFLLGFLNKIRKFILIGDHKQLPAVVVQSAERTKIPAAGEPNASMEYDLHQIGLTDMRNSYFERLWTMAATQSWDHVRGMLTKQGRMHQDIGQFVSSRFYANKLTIAKSEQEARLEPSWDVHAFNHEHGQTPAPHLLPDELLLALATKRLVFVNVPTPQDVVSYSKSKEAEAKLAAHLVLQKALSRSENRQHPEAFDPGKEIGVIAPFRNQVAMIEQEIENLAGDLSLNQDMISQLKNVTVDTVERFQGSQRKTIILSFTIVHDRQFAALSSFDQSGTVDRKLNVALSRAQEQLVMLGDAEVLSKNTLYADLLEHIKLHGAWVDGTKAMPVLTNSL